MNTAANLALTTALIGLITSILMGLLEKASAAIDLMAPLAKQITILVIAVLLVTGLNFFDLTLLPEPYQTPALSLLQGVIAALSGIGMQNVKRATTGDMPRKTRRDRDDNDA